MSFEAFKPEAVLRPSHELIASYHRMSALTQFFYFCLYVLGIEFVWFHKEWFQYYINNKNIFVISSRRHGKSTWTQALSVWEALRERKRILVVMNSTSQTGEWMRYTLGMLQDAVENLNTGVRITGIKYLESDLSTTQESIGRIQLSNGSVIYGRSLTSKIRGINADIIICDDLLDKKMNLSFEEAEHIFRAVILGVREDHTKVIYVGTILRQADILDKLYTGEISAEGGAKFVGDKYPAILDFEKQIVLWPGFRHWQWVMDQRSLVGEMDFQVEYMLNPLADALALVPRALSDKAKNRELILGRAPHPEATMVAGVDLQISPSSDADWSVYLTLELLHEEWRILDIDRLQAEETVQYFLLNDHLERNKCEDVIIESNGFQRIFSNTFAQTHKTDALNIATHHTGNEKNDTQVGIPSIRKLFSGGIIVIPWGDEYTREMMSIFIEELAGWQWDNEKGKFISRARHDDTTMAFWFAILAARAATAGGYKVISHY